MNERALRSVLAEVSRPHMMAWEPLRYSLLTKKEAEKHAEVQQGFNGGLHHLRAVHH